MVEFQRGPNDFSVQQQSTDQKQQIIAQPDQLSGNLPVATTEHQAFAGVRPYKIVLIGDGGVGKTSFVRRYLTGAYSREYIATIGAVTHQATFTTNYGEKIAVEIWDTAGQEANAGLSDIFYLNADAFIVLFDVTSRITMQNVKSWVKKAMDSVSDSKPTPPPVIICGNKIDDVKNRKVRGEMLRKNLPQHDEFVEMSVHRSQNVERPLLYCMSHILGRPDLKFVTNIDIAPRMFQTKMEGQVDETELYDAAMQFIPDEEPKGQ